MIYNVGDSFIVEYRLDTRLMTEKKAKHGHLIDTSNDKQLTHTLSKKLRVTLQYRAVDVQG